MTRIIHRILDGYQLEVNITVNLRWDSPTLRQKILFRVKDLVVIALLRVLYIEPKISCLPSLVADVDVTETLRLKRSRPLEPFQRRLYYIQRFHTLSSMFLRIEITIDLLVVKGIWFLYRSGDSKDKLDLFIL